MPTVAYPFSGSTLVREDVAACMGRVLTLGWDGQAEFERAAFLRLGDDGRFNCHVWPVSFEFHRVQWLGAPPVGTAAIIHSHPRTLPDPSRQDVQEARRLAIPVIVVTPESVVMVLPGDGRILRVHRHSAEAVRSALDQ
ncbi:MAG: Mov34/MPN/PAD-1 family protein [Thermoanaerobaculia bacterium]